MKLVYSDMGHILRFDEGYVNELVVENKKLFSEMVNSFAMQTEGQQGKSVLSIADKPVEFCKNADLTVQFAPFQINRKNLLTKLCAALEQRALCAENYIKTAELLTQLEKYIIDLGQEFSFEINCQKIAIGPVIRTLSPEIEETDKSTLEKIFAYMELIRELDRDRLFIMVNMRTYFSDEEMERFIESVCLHDFKVLLLENYAQPKLKGTKRFTVDADLCEF